MSANKEEGVCKNKEERKMKSKTHCVVLMCERFNLEYIFFLNKAM